MSDVPRPARLDELTVQERRHRAGQLYLRRQTIRQIARQLGVAVATVHGDLTALKEEWRRENLTVIGEALERDLWELDEMERDAVMQYTRTLAPVIENEDGTQTVHVGEALPWFLARLKVKERRAKMLGFDVPDAPRPGAGGDEVGGFDLERGRREFAEILLAIADEGEARRRVEQALTGSSGAPEGGLGGHPGPPEPAPPTG